MRPLLCPLVCLAALVAAQGAVAATKPPARTCEERIEVNGPIRFGGEDDVVVGRVAFSSLARYSDPQTFATAFHEPTGVYRIKAAVAVRANRNVKLSIVPAQRELAGLGYTSDRRFAEPGRQPVVLFAPCRSSQRAFSYDGKVGAATGFSGGLAVTEPMCLVLESRTRGREPVRKAVSLGMGDTCPQP